MEASEYKLLQEDPRVFRRVELADTCRHLGKKLPSVSFLLARTLNEPPIEKPLLHSGGADSDLFLVQMPLADVREVCGFLLDGEAAAVSSEGETTPLASEIASLVDRWTRYAKSLDVGPHNLPLQWT